MPYESGAQRRFFKMCEHTPRHARGKCPDTRTLHEFAGAERRVKARRALKGQP